MDNPYFEFVMYKASGGFKQEKYSKINHALRNFWRMTKTKEGTLWARTAKGIQITLFVKYERMRGYNRDVVKCPTDVERPRVSSNMASNYRRLPSKFNDLT